MQDHINVSIDFHKYDGPVVDVRIPYYQTVKQLLLDLCENLGLEQLLYQMQVYTLRVKYENLVLTDHDNLSNYKIGSGSILEVL